MDVRLKKTAELREGVPDKMADTPLTSLIWRSLRERSKRFTEEEHLLSDILANLAEETYHLRQTAEYLLRDQRPTKNVGGGDRLLGIASRMEGLLARLDISILSPEGDPYVGEWVEMFDSVAQLPDEGIYEPVIREVIVPAITRKSALLRNGKVVIGIPTQAVSERKDKEGDFRET